MRFDMQAKLSFPLHHNADEVSESILWISSGTERLREVLAWLSAELDLRLCPSLWPARRHLLQRLFANRARLKSETPGRLSRGSQRNGLRSFGPQCHGNVHNWQQRSARRGLVFPGQLVDLSRIAGHGVATPRVCTVLILNPKPTKS